MLKSYNYSIGGSTVGSPFAACSRVVVYFSIALVKVSYPESKTSMTRREYGDASQPSPHRTISLTTYLYQISDAVVPLKTMLKSFDFPGPSQRRKKNLGVSSIARNFAYFDRVLCLISPLLEESIVNTASHPTLMYRRLLQSACFMVNLSGPTSINSPKPYSWTQKYNSLNACLCPLAVVSI